MSWRERLARLRRRVVWPVLAAYVLAIAAAGFSMVYANRVARESEHRWCGLITTLDDAYRSRPPGSETGRELAADIARLRRDLGC